MRATASILHIDLDAFFASVEQRDKPSLRGKPVIVGGLGGRGVVSTASYEARVFGARSAMSMAEARRRAPSAAFLAGRFQAYRESSQIVMAYLHELSPLVEPLSLDEAFVDLAAGGIDCDDVERLARLADEVRAEVRRRTAGLASSVGVASSKFMAKLASEQAKPNGKVVIAPGSEVEVIKTLPVRVIPGVGPATVERLLRLGIHTVADLQRASERELSRELGQAAGHGLHELAFARDDRAVSVDREAKSVSVEDTFEVDVTDLAKLKAMIDRDAAIVADRLRRSQLFARTITLKLRLADFTTHTRSRTLLGATDDPTRIALVARSLLDAADVPGGVRLLGVGLANFTDAAQEQLFDDDTGPVVEEVNVPREVPRRREFTTWTAGMDVVHDDLGRGWVWGSGLGRVTVRFESRLTKPGPVRTFDASDPSLQAADPEPLPPTTAAAP